MATQRRDLCVVAMAADAAHFDSASHFAAAYSIGTIRNGACALAHPADRRAALNRHVDAITAQLVLAGALDANSAAEINADPRALGPGRALQELLNIDPSPRLHDEFDRWLRRFVGAFQAALTSQPL